MQTLPIAQAKGPKTDSGEGKKSADGQADFERDVGKQPVKPFIFRGQPLRNREDLTEGGKSDRRSTIRAPLGWDSSEIPWTTRADIPVSPDVKYVLIPEFVYRGMPEDQPMRRVVADHWKVAWAFRSSRCWELRLFERP